MMILYPRSYPPVNSFPLEAYWMLNNKWAKHNFKKWH